VKIKHLALTIAASAVASIAVGAAIGSVAVAAPKHDFVSVAEAKATYPSVARGFESKLPAGVRWPESLPAGVLDSIAEEEADGQTVQIERGYLEGLAAMHWLCSWEGELVSATDAGDQGRASVALSRLAQFVKLDWYQENYEDPEGEWFARVVEPARQGDLSGVIEDLAACG
jgi:hypothetical protein